MPVAVPVGHGIAATTSKPDSFRFAICAPAAIVATSKDHTELFRADDFDPKPISGFRQYSALVAVTRLDTACGIMTVIHFAAVANSIRNVVSVRAFTWGA